MQQHTQEPLLFHEGKIRVTATWLTIKDTSHALHNLRRVQLKELTGARVAWSALFFTSLAVVVLAGISLHRPGMPMLVGYTLLVLSVSLSLCAAWFAFVARDRFCLELALADGSKIRLERHGRRFMTQLESALRTALSLQTGAALETRVPQETGAAVSAQTVTS